MSEFKRTCECGRETRDAFITEHQRMAKTTASLIFLVNTKLDPIPDGYEYIPSICNPGCEKNVVKDDGIIR